MAHLMCSNCLTITETSPSLVGKVAKCPKCGDTGKIIADPKKDDVTNRTLAAKAEAQRAEIQRKRLSTNGRMVLSSGSEMLFDAVYMFRSDALMQLEQLQASAFQMLTPRSSGIGFVGDLGAVVAASLAVGVVEKVFNNASQSKGETLMQEYYLRRLELRFKGEFRPLYTVRQIQLADPSLWVSIDEDGATTYRLSDDPFIVVRVGGNPVSVRWQMVEQFWVDVPKNAPTTEEPPRIA